MSEVLAVFGILGTLVLGAMSPGPTFVVVSKISVSGSRLDGLAAALGVGLGGALFGTAALFGLSALLQQVDWLYVALKLAGGAYLVYLGYRLWKGATTPIAPRDDLRHTRLSFWRSFGVRFATQVSNPKTAVVYGSIFAALMPASPSTWFFVVLPPLFLIVETGWYTLVAIAFSSSTPRDLYLRLKSWVDRTVGPVMGVLGGKLLFDALQSQRSL